MKKSTLLYEKFILLLTLLLLIGGFSVDAWGAKNNCSATVGVGVGQGQAKVELRTDVFLLGDNAVDYTEYVSLGDDPLTASYKPQTSTDIYAKYYASSATGYRFEGWYENDPTCSGTAASNDSIWTRSKTRGKNWNICFYAKFIPKTYTVTFYKETGNTYASNKLGTATVTYDDTYGNGTGWLTTASKTGYTFAGWYKVDKTTKVEGTDKVAITTNLALYAHWTPNTYYVAFNGNGSTSGSMSNQTFTYATAQNLTANTFSKTDVVTFDPNGGSCGTASTSKSATFVGWATSAEGAKAYDDKQSVSNLTSTAGATFNLFAKWSQTNTITLPNATKSGYVLKGWSEDGVNIIGEADDTYSVPLGGITLTAIWIDKHTPVMTGANHSMEVGDEQATAFTLEHTDNPTAHISITSISAINNGDGKVIEYDAANNKIIAHNAGVATIYFTQAETSTIKSGTSATYTYTVTKKANTLAVASGTYSKYVDEQIGDVVTTRNNTTTALTTSSDASNVAYYDVATNKILIPNSEAEAFGSSKLVTIRIQQAENYMYVAAEKEIKLTVNKYANAVKVNNTANYSADVYFNDGIHVVFSSLNTNEPTAPYTVTQTPGTEEYATYYDNEEGQYIWTAPTPGTAVWTVTQAEDYKFLSASTTMTVHVVAAPAATGCYVLNSSAEQSLTTHINSTGGVQGQSMALSGPGATLTFKAMKNMVTAISGLYVEYSADGVSWHDINESALDLPSYTYSGGDFSYDISNLDVRYIRFEAKVGATYTKKIKDVRVTRKTYLTPSTANLRIDRDGDTYIHPEETAHATFTLNWSCASGGNLSLTTNDSKFRVEPATIENVDCNGGSTTITVYYDAEEAGDVDAKLYINNSVYSATVNLTGSATLRGQYISWAENVEFMEEGAEVENAASAMTQVTYTSSDPSVIDVINGGRTLVAISSGTATITASAVATNIYASATDSKIFTVTDEKPQYILWNQSLFGLHVGDENVVLTATASSSVDGCTTNGSRPITYSSADETVAKIVNGNELQIVGVGTTYITATQAGGEDADGHNYLAVSKNNKVIVTNPSAGCEAYLPIETTSGTLFDMNTNKPQVQLDIELNPATNGQPASVSFDTKTEKFAAIWLSGDLILAQKLNGEWSDVRNFGLPTESEYDVYTDIALNREATAIRFYRPAGGEGYFDIANISVKKARYIEAPANAYTIEAKVSEAKPLSITVNYSNVVGPIACYLSGTNPHFSIDQDAIEATCGDHGQFVVNVTYAPIAETISEADELTISDGQTTYTISLTGVATRTERSIVWSHPSEVYTIQTCTLYATTLSEYSTEAGDVKFRRLNTSTTGTLTNNVLTFDRTGVVNLEAYVDEDARYTMPDPVNGSIQVVLTPTEITTLPDVESVTLGSSLDQIVLTGGEAQNTYNHGVVNGTLSVISGNISTIGSQTITIQFTPNNGDMYASCTRTMTIEVVAGPYIYTGTGDWNTEGNWNVGSVPTSSDEVLIEGNVTVSGNVSVQGLTIAQGADVTLNVNGQLNIGSGNSQNLTGYGDLHVREGGQVNLSKGTLKVRNFTLDAALSGTKGGVHQNAASGQVANPMKLEVRGEAYFVLTIDPADALTYGWYDFTVPFEVEISNDIYRYGENTPMRSGVDFMIMEYSESRRATGARGWVNASGTLQPGRAYTIGLDKWEYTTYVFKKKAVSSATGTNSFNAVASAGASQTRGWNGLGNGSLSHAQLTGAFSNAKVQIYDHAHNVYITKEANESNFAVGTAFFIQVSEAQTISYEAAQENRTLMAPSREVYTTDEFRLTLKDAETENETDRLWLSASEEATEEYVIGQDLLKMGTPTSGTVAQMWTTKGGKVLCDVETAMNGERATAPLSFYAPKAGQYELAIDQAPEDVTLYLTYNDQVIWILSFGSYVFDLEKGTTEGYGLRMETNRAPQIATGIDEQTAGAQNRKVMINNTLYIVTAEGAIFDVMGKNIK